MAIALALVGQALLLLSLAPLLEGLLAGADARLALRRGPGFLQEYHDLWKWLRRAPLRAAESTPISAVAPSVALVATTTAGLLVPTLALQAPLGDGGDLIALIFLLLLAHVARVLAALDAGGPDAAPATGRDLATRLPPLLLALAVICAQEGTSSLSALIAAGGALHHPSQILALAALALLVGAGEERRPGAAGGRPGPAMGGPALLAQAAGRDLALLRWASLAQRLVLLSILADLCLPWGLADAGQISGPSLAMCAVLYPARLIVVGLALAAIRTALSMSRRGLIGADALLELAALLALLALACQALLHA